MTASHFCYDFSRDGMQRTSVLAHSRMKSYDAAHPHSRRFLISPPCRQNAPKNLLVLLRRRRTSRVCAKAEPERELVRQERESERGCVSEMKDRWLPMGGRCERRMAVFTPSDAVSEFLSWLLGAMRSEGIVVRRRRTFSFT